ncbi:hypothetical protein ACMFMG_005167 [Clarireedia jacksonii]
MLQHRYEFDYRNLLNTNQGISLLSCWQAPDVSGGTSRHRPPYHPIAISSFVDILSTKLRSLWCIEQLLAKRRVHGPIPADIVFGAKPPHLVETCPLLTLIAKLGRVCMSFDYIENDPRYVEQDLKTLTFSQDPRRLYASWHVFEKSLGVRRAGPFRFNICIAKEMEPLEEWEPDEIEGHVSTKLGIHQMVNQNRQFETDDWEHVMKFRPKGLGPDEWGYSKRGYRLEEEKEKYMQLVEKATTTIGMHKQVFQASEAPSLEVFDI